MPEPVIGRNGRETTGNAPSTNGAGDRPRGWSSNWPIFVDRLVSSAHLRRTQTLEPLAEERGLPIEERPELQEGASREETVALMHELGDRAALCTHGEVLEELVGEAGQKGSTRVVELRDGAPVVRQVDLPPPA